LQYVNRYKTFLHLVIFINDAHYVCWSGSLSARRLMTNNSFVWLVSGFLV